MKIYLFLFSLLLSFNSYSQQFIPNELIIQCYEPIEVLHIDQRILADSYDTHTILESENIYKITYNSPVELALEIKKWNTIKGVKYVMKNFIAKNRNRPNDQFFSEQLAFELMNVERAWDLTTGGSTRDGREIVVAVVDDGFDLNHEDLIDNIWINVHEIDGDGIDNDGNGYIDDIYGIRCGTDTDDHIKLPHGSSVVGTIGANGNNEKGVSGINWNIKVMTISSNGTVDQIIESYSYILNQRRRYNTSLGQEGSFVVATNASFGLDNEFAEDFPIWCDMYDLLGFEGILSVGATTNEPVDVDEVGDMPTTCPSKYLIGVTTTDGNNILDAGVGSTSIDIVAPGDLGYTTNINNTYRAFSGTSSATPMLAGAIGLIYALDSDIINSNCSPNILASTIKEILINTVIQTNTFRTNTVSGGILDIEAACKGILELDAKAGNENSLLSICSFSSGPLTNTFVAQISNPDLEEYELAVYNTAGQIVKILDQNEQDCYKIDLSGLSSGLYYFSVISDNSKSTKKFFKL